MAELKALCGEALALALLDDVADATDAVDAALAEERLLALADEAATFPAAVLAEQSAVWIRERGSFSSAHITFFHSEFANSEMPLVPSLAKLSVILVISLEEILVKAPIMPSIISSMVVMLAI